MSARTMLLPDFDRSPPWLAPTIQALEDLTALDENWDGEGAPRIATDRLAAGARLLSLTMQDDSPAPEVIPTSDGGVAFEWHMRDIDLEIEVVSPAEFHVYFADKRSDTEVSEDMTIDSTCVAECLAELTRR